MLWRDPRWTGVLMLGYAVLSLAVGPDGFLRVGTGPVGPGAFIFGALAAAFFAWRVSRGGRASRMLLIICTAIAFLVAAFEIAPRFGLAVFAVLAACAAQLALLLSPAVYRRTRPPGWTGSASWARVRPPLTLVSIGLLAGLAITLLGLFLRGALAVHWSALLKDLVEYTVLSEAVLYGCWLGPRSAQHRERARPRLSASR
jgi:hypothetical protein